MDINERIKYLAGRRGWTEYRLVKESHLPASTIANIYHRSTVPSISTLEAICDALGITLSQFFSDDEMVALSTDQKELLDQWSRLSKEQRTLFQNLFKTMN